MSEIKLRMARAMGAKKPQTEQKPEKDEEKN